MRSWPLALIFLAGCRCSADVPEPETRTKVPYQAVTYEDVVSIEAPDARGCLDCMLELRTAVRQLDGIGRVEVIINEARLDIQYDPKQVSVEDLVEATRRTKYPGAVKEIDGSDDRGIEGSDVERSDDR